MNARLRISSERPVERTTRKAPVAKKKKPVEKTTSTSPTPTQTEPTKPVQAGQTERLRLNKERSETVRTQLEQKLPTTPKPEEVTPERRAQIEAFDQKLSEKPDRSVDPRSAGFNEARKVSSALRGESELGQLNEPESKLLLDSSMKRWTGETQNPADRKINYAAINELALDSAQSPTAGKTVAQYYTDRAANMIAARAPGRIESIEDRALAPTLITDGMLAVRSSEDRRQVLEKLGPERAGMVSYEIAKTPRDLLATGSTELGRPYGFDLRLNAMSSLLEATTVGPPTDASRAAVNAAFAGLDRESYGAMKQIVPGLSKALALHWNPDDAEARTREEQRLTGILTTSQGQELVADTTLGLEQRLQNLDLVRRHPEWNAEFMQSTSSAFTNPVIARAIATPRIDQYAELRGDTPQALVGTNLENTIGASMNLPPEGVPENETVAQRDQRERDVAEGRRSYFDGPNTRPLVEPIANMIREVGGDTPKVTVVPIQFSGPGQGTVQMSLYRVQDKTTGEDRFVDNLGRRYPSFEAWKKENQLPYGIVTHPKDGHLPEAGTGATPEVTWTPESSNGSQAKNIIDKAALVGGMVAGGAIILGSGGILAPAVIGGATVWGMARSGDALLDRKRHGQSIDPLTDAGARAEWINLAASTLSLASLGATGLAGRAVSSGSRFSSTAATTASVLRVGASSLDAVAAANSGYTLYANWDKLSGSERAQLALSAGFWGVSSVANAKLGRRSITEPFNFKKIRQETLYGSLDPQVKTAVDRAVTKLGVDAEPNIAQIVSTSEFKGMTRERQSQLIDTFGSMTKEQLTAQSSAFRARQNGDRILLYGTSKEGKYQPYEVDPKTGKVFAKDGTEVELPATEVERLRTAAQSTLDQRRARTERRLGLSSADKEFEGPEPNLTAPDPAQLQAIRAKMKKNERLSAEETELLMTDAAVRVRRGFSRGESLDDALSSEGLFRSCEYNRDAAYHALVDAGIKPEKIKLHQATKAFGSSDGYPHGFLTVDMPDGKTYLVDTSFRQFFDSRAKGAGQIGYPGALMRSSTQGSAIADQLLKRGYVELTDDVVREYGGALSSGKTPTTDAASLRRSTSESLEWDRNEVSLP